MVGDGGLTGLGLGSLGGGSFTGGATLCGLPGCGRLVSGRCGPGNSGIPQSKVDVRREFTAATTYWTALLTGLISTVCGLILVVAVVYLVQNNRHRAELNEQAIREEHDQLRASLDRNTLLELENRRMDQYMRTIVEQVQDYAIFGMDADCRATTWNEGVLQVLGFEESEFIGQDIRQLIFTPEAVELGIPEAEFEMAAKEGSASDDRWMMRKCGKRFWASGITSAVKHKDEVIGFSKVMRDLTEQKRNEDEMAELASKLSESNRRKNEFLATLAHELRNPLAPVKNAIELMGMSELSKENQELRMIAARQVEQMIRLIDDLLDVSRIEHGKISLQRKVVDLRNVIESALEAASPSIAEKGQKLTVSLCDTEVIVDVDSARLTQVFCNLLNNASRYSDSGCQISLSLSVDNSGGDLGKAVVTVEDDGIGISPDRLDEIFQLFSQVYDPTGRGDRGLGIGLAVSAKSDGIGRGSQFIVNLPLTTVNSVATPQENIPERPLCVQSFKVLVVEDMRALRTIMSLLLKRLGHEVKVAENGLEALEKLTEFTPDIIFSDIAMPGMTGYDLARKLREQPAFDDTYLVAMSGYGQLSDRTESRRSGFDEHMVKPVDFAKLLELFKRLSAEAKLRSE
jgi:PAS domain S-box-containing protein